MYIYIHTYYQLINDYAYKFNIRIYIYISIHAYEWCSKLFYCRKTGHRRSFMSGTMPKAVVFLRLCWCPFCRFGVGALIKLE